MAKKLLLADDSVTIQKVVGISFASEDVTLITVDNGDDAISKAKESRPDAILADVVMPGKSGYEVCEAIKADPALQHIPVLLLTGTFESFDEERAQRCGAAGHVAKPFEAQALVERVRQLFAQPVAPPPAPEPIAAPPAAEPIAVAAPASTPEQAPAPPSSDSFDFFDDDLADLAPAEPAEAGPTDPDGAFAFGDQEFDTPQPDPLVSSEPEPASAAPLDRTVAILPDEIEADLDVPAAAPTELDASLEPAGPGTTAEDLLPAELADPVEPVAPPTDDFFDFDIGGSSAEAADTAPPVRSEDLAEATVLDPKGASGYDVSSSDLGDPVSAELFGEVLASEDSLAMPIFGEALETASQTPIPATEPSAPEPLVEPEPEMPREPATPAFEVAADEPAWPAEPAEAPVPAWEAEPADAPAPAWSPEPADAPAPAWEAEPADAPAPAWSPEPADAPAPAWEAEPANAPAPAWEAEPANAPAPAWSPEPADAPEPAWPPEPDDTLEPVATLEPTTAPEAFAAPEPSDAPEPVATPEPAWPPEPATPAFEVAEDEAPGEPAASALELDESSLEDLMPPARVEEPRPLASADDGQAAAVLEQITPRLREQLHDTLEKIAWESFGDVTEQIVRTALERVEQIAWEVIPQMAETMIREEIRRMKGESEE